MTPLWVTHGSPGGGAARRGQRFAQHGRAGGARADGPSGWFAQPARRIAVAAAAGTELVIDKLPYHAEPAGPRAASRCGWLPGPRAARCWAAGSPVRVARRDRAVGECGGRRRRRRVDNHAARRRLAAPLRPRRFGRDRPGAVAEDLTTAVLALLGSLYRLTLARPSVRPQLCARVLPPRSLSKVPAALSVCLLLPQRSGPAVVNAVVVGLGHTGGIVGLCSRRLKNINGELVPYEWLCQIHCR